jgi:predicted ribosomally synthesized peptide with nif11-like leader
MSLESAKEFFELIKSDKQLAQRLFDANSEKELRAVIASQGDYDFSQKEWVSAVLAKTGVEISDEDLEQVAGGTGAGSWGDGPNSYLTVTMNNLPPIFVGMAG